MISYRLGSKAYRTIRASVNEQPIPGVKNLMEPLFRAAVVNAIGIEIVMDGDLEPEDFEVWDVKDLDNRFEVRDGELKNRTEQRLIQKGTVNA